MDIEAVVDSGPRVKRCIVIAIAGARSDYLERYDAPHMRKLAEEGVRLRNAIASNGLAETANGFTTIATSLTTSGHGIFTSREWYDRELDRLVYVYDGTTNELELKVPTVAERIKTQHPGTRVASISTKDRLAVLQVGMSADLISYSYREYVFHRHTKGFYTGRGVTDDGYQFTERAGYTLPPFLQNIHTTRRVRWSGLGFDHFDQDAADTVLIDRFIMEGALVFSAAQWRLKDRDKYIG
jgi:hypothetical protein